jgi:hypothetical protein
VNVQASAEPAAAISNSSPQGTTVATDSLDVATVVRLRGLTRRNPTDSRTQL